MGMLYLFSVIGGVVVLGSYVQVSLWMTAAERQSNRIRNRFLYNVLRQDIGWFDTHETGELNTRLAEWGTVLHAGYIWKGGMG